METLAYDRQCEVVLENVRVSKEKVVGRLGQALPTLVKLPLAIATIILQGSPGIWGCKNMDNILISCS